MRSVLSDPWTVARQAVGPWDFPVRNTGVGYHFPPQEIFPNPGIKAVTPVSSVWAGTFFTTEPRGKAVKIATIPKLVYRHDVIPFKILQAALEISTNSS